MVLYLILMSYDHLTSNMVSVNILIVTVLQTLRLELLELLINNYSNRTSKKGKDQCLDFFCVLCTMYHCVKHNIRIG